MDKIVVNNNKSYSVGFVSLVFVIWWMVGLVWARGFFETVFALFPPYAYYLVTERVMTMFGLA